MVYIANLVKKVTNGDEKEMMTLFEFGQKEGDIPKNLKYSRENLIKSLFEATAVNPSMQLI